MAIKDRINVLFRRPDERTVVSHTEEDVAEARRVIRALEQTRRPTPTPLTGRSATEEERLVAAWANLAIEEPDFRLEDARRMKRAQKERATAAT